MLSVKQICTLARLNVGDAGHTKYSDYEVLAALQAGLDLLYAALSDYWSPVLVKTATLELTDDRAVLPDDFDAVVSVQDTQRRPLVSNYDSGPFSGEYRMENNEIVSPETPVILTYRSTPGGITSMEGTLTLPQEFQLVLARLVASVLKGEFNAAKTQAEEAAQTSKRRRYENTNDPELWGGYNP